MLSSDPMARTKPVEDRLDTNLLVPFTHILANKIRGIARANGVHNTMVIRMIIDIGLEEIEKGRELKLVIPKGGE